MAEQWQTIPGLPGPSKEEVELAQAFEGALDDLHKIMAMVARSIPLGIKLTTTYARGGASISVTFIRKEKS